MGIPVRLPLLCAAAVALLGGVGGLGYTLGRPDRLEQTDALGRDGGEVPVERDATTQAAETGTLRSRLHDVPVAARVAVWALLFGAAPLAALPWIRRTLARESNRRNALLVLAVAAPAAAGGWVLTGFADEWVGAILTLASAGAAMFYSYHFCTRVEALRR